MIQFTSAPLDSVPYSDTSDCGLVRLSAGGRLYISKRLSGKSSRSDRMTALETAALKGPREDPGTWKLTNHWTQRSTPKDPA